MALRKIEGLLSSQASITVIAPRAIDKIRTLSEQNKLSLIEREYKSPEAQNYYLAVSATDNEAVNRIVSADCLDAGVLINVVDKPNLCSFIVPSVMAFDDLTIAISTNGKAPFLTKWIREELERIIPDYWGRLLEIAYQFRRDVFRKYNNNPQAKSRCFREFTRLDWEAILSGDDEKAVERNIKYIMEKASVD